MITEQAQERARILTFWKKHGTEAVLEAYGVHRRTLFYWQKNLKKGGGKIQALNSGSKSPKVTRRRLWDANTLDEIRRLRDKYPNLGEEKLYPFLTKFCTANNLPCPKPVTIGRPLRQDQKSKSSESLKETKAFEDHARGTCRRPRHHRTLCERMQEVHHHL